MKKDNYLILLVTFILCFFGVNFLIANADCIRHTNYTTTSLKSEPPHRSLRAITSLLESHR